MSNAERESLIADLDKIMSLLPQWAQFLQFEEKRKIEINYLRAGLKHLPRQAARLELLEQALLEFEKIEEELTASVERICAFAHKQKRIEWAPLHEFVVGRNGNEAYGAKLVLDAVRYELESIPVETPQSQATPTETQPPQAETQTNSNQNTTAIPASKTARAIAILSDHPDWTNEQIANAVPMSANYLSQNHRFRAARDAIRQSGMREHRRAEQHRGSDMEEYEDEG